MGEKKKTCFDIHNLQRPVRQVESLPSGRFSVFACCSVNVFAFAPAGMLGLQHTSLSC